jgi:hypothetical protein
MINPIIFTRTRTDITHIRAGSGRGGAAARGGWAGKQGGGAERHLPQRREKTPLLALAPCAHHLWAERAAATVPQGRTGQQPVKIDRARDARRRCGGPSG